ncbi:hypothetical protein CHS0354_000290 [Potamilus streckersoni]|uniref:Cadherin domain-containing protein n=1 Tax=Potamilus streckersoni TaxID=2493646 RepID=A0AAE0RYX2_9BIVA|nr:hypothetical protein CHS0354_000290 [Potamilus streckersoni]
MKTGYKFFIWFLCFCFTEKYVKSQACTGSETMGWPGGGDANSIGKQLDNLAAGTGYLLPLTSYTATCCGYVSQIEAFHDNTATTTAQVWRPTGGISYRLIGAISITGRHMFTYNVPSANQVPVKVGDVVGWYSSSANMVSHKPNTGLNGNLYKTFASETAVNTTVDWSSASNMNDVTYAMKFYLGASSIPTFTNLAVTTTVFNSAAVATSVYTVSATDADVNDVATLTITRTDTNSFFSFDTATKQVTIGSVLVGAVGDHELVFEVSDSCDTATSTLTITVENTPPTIHNLDNSTSISENTQVATLLYTLSVTDPTDTVSCSLLTASVPFTVRQISGSTTYGIYSNSNPGFNYVTRNNYPLSIECTDGYDPVTGTFTVYLVRNSAPNITNLPAEVTLSTASTTGSVVYTVTSTDAENDQLYYNMTCTPSSCPFTILDSGVIQVTQSLRDLTTVGYDVSVWVYDGRTLVGPKTLTVDITDINGAVSINNLPLGSALPVFENTALSTSIFQVSVTDPNAGDTHTYTMTSSPGSGMNYFSIDGSTGQISTSGTLLNYESLATKTFDFTITVSDGSSTDSKILSIQVVNENENPSFNQAIYSISANEAASGTVLPDPGYGVTEPDAGDTKSFSNDCGTNTGLFSMSSATGRLTLASSYDYDLGTLPTTVTCIVKVTDSGGLTATATLSINFNNINDNTPIFVPSSYTFFASYDATISTSIGIVTATDGDLGTYGIVSYSLDQSSLPSAYFGIDGTTGKLYISSSVSPIGIGNSVSFKAIATDGGGLTSTATVTVKIAITTTVATTTTTDRYRTFFEDGRNIAWIVLCGLVSLAIIVFVFWLACQIYREGCPKFKCFQKKEKIVKRKFIKRRPPSPPPKQPRKMPTIVPSPKRAPPPPPPPPPPPINLPPYEGFQFWKENDFSKRLLMFK